MDRQYTSGSSIPERCHGELRSVLAAFWCVRRAKLHDRPSGGFNLVCLRDSKDVRLSYDRDRLQIDDVRLEHVERVAQEYIDTRFRKQRSQEREDQLLRLRTALYAAARPEGLARALKVSAKGVGIPELKAMRGNTGIKLEVAILPRKEFKIAFKFLKHLDHSGKVINATKWTPDDVPWLLTKLNWTFGAQANIFFTLVDATWFTVQKALEPKISRDVFRKDIVPFKRRDADLTCFLVGDYDAMDNEAAGEFLPDQQVCVVVDQGNPPVFDYGEAFIGVMAHEVGHFCTTNGTCPGVDTMTEAVFCFPAAWKAYLWTSSSSATSTRGESARSRLPFGTLRPRSAKTGRTL